MQKLLVVLLCALVAFAASADVSAEVETGVASLPADFEAEVQSAIESDHETTEDDSEAEAAAEEEAEPVLLESVSEEEINELQNDLAEVTEMESEVDAAEAGELVIETTESEEELEAEFTEVEGQCNTFEQAVESSEAEDMRMAQHEGFFGDVGSAFKNAGKAALKAGGTELKKGLVKAGKNVIDKAVKLVKKVASKVKNSKIGKAVGKLVKKAGKLAKKVIKAGKKIIKKLLGKNKHKKHPKKKEEKKKGKRVQCKDGTFSKKGGIQGACSTHGGLCKKAGGCSKKVKKDKKKKKTAVGERRKRPSKKALAKLCKKGPAGKACRDNKKCADGKKGHKCRKARCKAHRLGCRYACKRGGWSTRRHSKALACRSRGGVMEPQPHDQMTDALETQLDISQGVITADGAIGANANGQPDQPDMGSATGATDAQGRPIIDPETGRPNLNAGPAVGKVGKPYDSRDEEDRDNLPKNGKGMWNGVDPKFHGQADVPSVPRLPEDVEDCVACQYVWKQVEQDVGNSAITQTIYDSFHANAIDAQRTPVFYPAVQTMFDAADDMIGDYMEGFTVNQLCENSMLCRPRDLRQFLKHQRVTKGI